MNQPKITTYWESAALLLVVSVVQVLLFLLLLYMYVLDKGNPSVLEILSGVLISAAHALPAMLLCVGNRRVVYTFSTADSFCFCLNDS